MTAEHGERHGLWHETIGDGPTLLTVHAIGLDHQQFRPWLDGLAGAAEVVYFDYREHGRSRTNGPGTLSFTHDDLLADVDQMRVSLGRDTVFLFGHSYGAFLALEYAVKYPQRVSGLILCGGAAVLDYVEGAMGEVAARCNPVQLSVLQRLMTGQFEGDDDFAMLWTEILPLYFVDADPKRLARVCEGMRLSGAAFAHTYAHCLPGYDLSGRLGEVSAPTLILNGIDDWLTPVDPAARRLAEGIPAAELVVFERSGHYPFVEETDRFVEVVRRFVERTTRSRA